MRKIIAEAITFLFLLGVFCLIAYSLIINFGIESVWGVLGIIGTISLGSYTSMFVDWLFEDKEKKDE